MTSYASIYIFQKPEYLWNDMRIENPGCHSVSFPKYFQIKSKLDRRLFHRSSTLRLLKGIKKFLTLIQEIHMA